MQEIINLVETNILHPMVNTRYKSAITGRFGKKTYADKNPKTSFKTTLNPPEKKKK